MMLFQLLPYFLAAQVSTNTNDTWKYGPEYLFSGHAKMITSLDQDKGKLLGTGLYLKLKCRPREPDILRCKMDNTEITKLQPQAFDIKYANNAQDDGFRPFTVFNEDFEIKFNEKGIESYIVDEKTPLANWGMNMVRLIANQLSIGIDLSDEMRPTYKALENFTVGECDVDYRIIRMPWKSDPNQNMSFELKPLEKIGKFGDESIEVQKRRHVKDCLRTAEPFFGTRYALGLIPKDSVTKLLSSESKILLSKTNFTSETINENEIYDKDRKKLGKIIDHMKLDLESIYPTTTELPTFVSQKNKEILPDRMEDNSRY
ncbi:uncharacterized protein [Chelonus insularis]|uniref:uncharacterized protein n=1 Tax=Chelonus insularis TaxID=460826 RepID=UPI00158C2196|nr:uncharacterized protein LOC118067084 [Chelonus insularis]